MRATFTPKKIEDINVHKYGAHIFHTNNKKVWNYITQFAEFNRFTNSPVANYKGELYSLPFNMYTFNKMWGVVTPEEATEKIEEQRREITGNPQNLEEQAISLVGRDIYEKLIKGYTEKQWGRDCKDLPAFIIKRLPVRLTFDNNYFNALYQGIPIGGYTKMIANLLDGIEVRLDTDYLEHKSELDAMADKIVYTGPIDAYFGYKLGPLEYRSVRFETETLDKSNFQGNAAVNYTDSETPWTRIIEHALGPSEFIYMISYAKLILTDSFHACVFSFIFEKPFIVFDRQDNTADMMSRIENLLKTFSIERKYASSGMENDLFEADYQIGHTILNEKRKESIKYLENISDSSGK